MTALVVGGKVWRDADEGRRLGELRGWGSFYVEAADLVEVGDFAARIGDGLARSGCTVVGAEMVLCVCGLAYGDNEGALIFAKLAVDPKHIAKVTVAPLVKTPREPNARLDGDYEPFPGDLASLGPLLSGCLRQ